ncbi:hypothetical protein Rsub_08281 [Raphidocelis subcapitata]|uniref:Erythromycin biosynthesis protein CIII-like C-terminal domain-containing protein n=1 Tax=Raphidocelis subcapitata TaxID=307507 RepID=A0A2V0PBJ0_9CHLO|nr:hypothetical protein Rsub_08281 [Raphidocelis subcapitata]|eukprot:GBF95250.1 hypothetical protein Rsub_08281 [Raphidocelis subcapitata]
MAPVHQPQQPQGLDSLVVVAFVAMGTRGDVQPLAALAFHLAATRPGVAAVFITHAAHAPWLRDLLPGLPLGAGLPHPTAAAAGAAEVDGPEAREAVVAAVCGALDLPTPPPGGGGPHAHGAAGAARDGGARPSGRLVVFNLFALEAYSIAQALGVGCVAAHPYPPPAAPPASFERRLAAAYPSLHAVLRAAGRGGAGGSVGWGEVGAWMWPLFTSRWGAWRQERLALPPVPLAGWRGGEDGGGSPGAGLPPAVPLLYGFSELVAPRPGHWPASVHTTGPWLQRHLRERHPGLAAAWQLPPELLEFLDACTEGGGPPGPVVIDFGSMGAMGLLPPAPALLEVLLQALEAAGMRGVLLSGGWAALADAHAALPPPRRARLHLLAGPLCAHDRLLARAAVVLHHGGSGTVAAALAAGTPQVVVPLLYDQPFWAGRLEHAGLAPPPLDRSALGGGGGLGRGGGRADEGGTGGGKAAGPGELAAAAATLASRLRAALSPGIARACADMAAALRSPEECGIERGAELIWRQASLGPGGSALSYAEPAAG